MREEFPRHIKPGDRMSAGWFNRAGELLDRVGKFTSGSTLNGLRTNSFDSDLAKHVPIIRPFRIMGYEKPSPSNDTISDYQQFPPGVNAADPNSRRELLLEQTNDLVYRGRMIRWNVATAVFTLDNIDYAPYKILANRVPQQFVLPGDVLVCVYDETRGAFVVVDLPLRRPARARATGPYPSKKALFDIYSGVAIDKDFPLNEHLSVEAIITWDLSEQTTIKAGQKVWLNYIQPSKAWFLDSSVKTINHIHFRLTTAMSASVDRASAIVEHTYDPAGPGVDVFGTMNDVTVFNPPAGCTGNPFRFSGPIGCKGQATWSLSGQQWWVWQLDCVNP